MTALPELNGWFRLFLITLDLSFRNPQGIVYGYLVPIIFLLAFGSVFRADDPPLLARMGQIMTITILGGAVFWTSDGAGRRTRKGHLAALPFVADPGSLAGFERHAGARVDCRLLRPGSTRSGPRHLWHAPSRSSGSGHAGVSLCDRGLPRNRAPDRGAGGQCARGSSARPVYLSPDDHDRRSGSAVGSPAALGATGRRLYAGPLRGRGPATLLQRAERTRRRRIPIGGAGRDRPGRGDCRGETLPLGRRPENCIRALVGGRLSHHVGCCRCDRLGNGPVETRPARGRGVDHHHGGADRGNWF